MRLSYKLERDDDGRVLSGTADGDIAVRCTIQDLAKAAASASSRKIPRACTLAIEKMLKTYKGELHGESGLTDAVEEELRLLHELHPNRILIRRICDAHKGVSCEYAFSHEGLELDGKMRDICTYGDDCPFTREVPV